MTVVVFGAAGGVGSRVVRTLVAGGHDVVGVVRRTEAAEELDRLGARAHLADVASDQVGEVLTGADAVVWALGARFATDGPDGAARIDRAGAIAAIDAGVAAGVARWVQVSSMLADRPESGPPMLAPFLQAKGAADEHLAATGLDYTIVRPSGLADSPGTGQVSAAEHLGPEDWGAPMPPQVTRDDVATVVLACLLDGSALRRAFDLSGGSTPISDALGAL